LNSGRFGYANAYQRKESAVNRDAVLDIEESFWRSSGDEDFYRTHVADEGLFVFSMGVMRKEDVVAAMAESEPWESFEIGDPSWVSISNDVVGLVYEAHARRHADAGDYRANILSVYRRQEKDWQLILHQQTPL
jgi:hypothetical protein